MESLLVLRGLFRLFQFRSEHAKTEQRRRLHGGFLNERETEMHWKLLNLEVRGIVDGCSGEYNATTKSLKYFKFGSNLGSWLALHLIALHLWEPFQFLKAASAFRLIALTTQWNCNPLIFYRKDLPSLSNTSSEHFRECRPQQYGNQNFMSRENAGLAQNN